MNKTELTPTPTPPLGGARFLTSKEVMPIFGYTDNGAFWAAIHAAGVPFIKFNQRKILFEESAVKAWLDSRRVGGTA